MAKQVLYTVNFGATQGGLSTIGYTIYNYDGTVKSVRSTAGIVEIGSSTGIYAAQLNVNEGDNVVVLWDTGTATPRYAAEEYRNQLNQIQDETDNIRIIWNSLRNQGEFYSKLTDNISELKAVLTGLVKIVNKIDEKKLLGSADVKQALQETAPSLKVPTPIVNFPEDIRKLLGDIMGQVKTIPKTQKEYSNNFSNISNMLTAVERKLSKNLSDNSEGLLREVQFLKTVFLRFDDIVSKLDIKGNEIGNSKKAIIDEIKRLNMYIYDFVSSPYIKEAKDTNELLMAFGHKGK